MPSTALTRTVVVVSQHAPLSLSLFVFCFCFVFVFVGVFVWGKGEHKEEIGSTVTRHPSRGKEGCHRIRDTEALDIVQFFNYWCMLTS